MSLTGTAPPSPSASSTPASAAQANAPPSAEPRAGRAFRWRALMSPPILDRWAARLIPWAAGVAVLSALLGLWVGFLVAPTDHQQGEVYRLIYLHVPAAWMSMLLYLAAATHAAAGLVWRTRLSPVLARALAPTGALFTVIALWTGAAWGKPTWGTWWVWDARLTSELLLLFLYLGYLALIAAIDDPQRADRAGALLLLVGVVNLPVIYFSVQWWHTLHQGATIRWNAAPAMAPPMLAGLLLMTLACWAYAFAAVMTRARCLLRERGAEDATLQDTLHSLASRGALRQEGLP